MLMKKPELTPVCQYHKNMAFRYWKYNLTDCTLTNEFKTFNGPITERTKY